jgi:transcriptional regulator with XRE-family HTH domain
MTFGRILQQERENKRLSQSELSELSGVTQPTLSSWETDRTKPDINDLKRLSKALQIPAATFFEENPSIKLVQHNKEQNQQNQAIVNQYNYDSERKIWEELDKSRQETIVAQQDTIEALKLALGLQKEK